MYLLNLVYLLLTLLAAPWLVYQRWKHGKYREGWDAKLLGRVPRRTGERPCLWLHAVSVGEVNLLEPLLKRWDLRHPDWDVVISTTTQAGYHLARKKYAPRPVVYCPLDFSWAVRRAMRRIRPTLLVLTELELWPNLIAAAKERGARVAVINGRLGDRSFRGYRRLGWLVRRTMARLDRVAAQNEQYAERFRQLGARPDAVAVTGSMKFDGARTQRDNAETQRLARLAGIAPDDCVFLAGSTQEPEEAIALSVYQRLSADFPHLRLILVPRHPERFADVAALLDRSGLAWQRRSQLTGDRSTSSHPPREDATEQVAPGAGITPSQRAAPARVLLVDGVGELGDWWGTAQIAFVGGSFTSRGGQNMIEPAAYGAAVSFGPNTWNFRDVVAVLREREAAAVVQSEQELESFVRRCLTDREFAQALGRRAQALVLEQQGATDRTMALLESLVQHQQTHAWLSAAG